MDNRPLRWEEFVDRIGQTIYLSATPGPYELAKSDGYVEQLIRPTGLVDPEIVLKPTKGQIDDLMGEIRTRSERNERVLVTTLTKKMAEDLTDYLMENGVRTRYLHSEVDTLRRIELLRELRLGVYDVLVGINLLREGLDLPEVSLVSILDADKEGFLRSRTLADPDDRPGGAERGRSGAHVRRQDHPVDGCGDRRDQPAAGQAGRLQHRTRPRPAAAAQEDRRPHRPARPRGRRHRPSWSAGRAARRPTSPVPLSAEKSRDLGAMPSSELAGLISELTEQMHARSGGTAVRAGRPAARRDRRPEEDAAADAGSHAADGSPPPRLRRRWTICRRLEGAIGRLPECM